MTVEQTPGRGPEVPTGGASAGGGYKSPFRDYGQLNQKTAPEWPGGPFFQPINTRPQQQQPEKQTRGGRNKVVAAGAALLAIAAGTATLVTLRSGDTDTTPGMPPGVEAPGSTDDLRNALFGAAGAQMESTLGLPVEVLEGWECVKDYSFVPEAGCAVERITYTATDGSERVQTTIGYRNNGVSVVASTRNWWGEDPDLGPISFAAMDEQVARGPSAFAVFKNIGDTGQPGQDNNRTAAYQLQSTDPAWPLFDTVVVVNKQGNNESVTTIYVGPESSLEPSLAYVGTHPNDNPAKDIAAMLFPGLVPQQ